MGVGVVAALVDGFLDAMRQHRAVRGNAIDDSRNGGGRSLSAFCHLMDIELFNFGPSPDSGMIRGGIARPAGAK